VAAHGLSTAPTEWQAPSTGGETIHNYYVSLSAFFTWSSREFSLPNPIKTVPPPTYQEAPIEPFSKEEDELLPKACEFSVEVQPSNRRKFIVRRWADKRDQAIILALLDTLGKAVRRALWLYLSSREDGQEPDAPLFVGKFNRPMNRDVQQSFQAV
jgi:integrase/recombinase XerD